jgi:signal transduction histidine kinase
MAMQNSSELRELVLVIFQQMQGLGLSLNICNILLVNEKTSEVDYWLSVEGQGVLPKNYHIPYFDHPVYHSQLNAWRQAKPFETFELSGESKKIWEDFLYTTDLKQLSASVWDMMRSMEKIILSSVATKNGLLQTVTSEPLSEDSISILQRFANVFDQTYTRFLDLQKAEAQAREAQIQLALERVRARTMAMRESSELSEASLLLFMQLKQLGADLWTCGFGICEKDNEEITEWMTHPNLNLMLAPLKFRSSSSIKKPFFDAWQSGTELYSKEWEGPELQNLQEDVTMEMPVFQQLSKEWEQAGLKPPTYQLDYVATHKYGYIYVITTRPFEQPEIIVRFAKVFEQTYTRFLDLQKSEERAQSAILEASLERVRAETASMRNAADLERIIPMIWKELRVLDVAFIRCGVFIVDDNHQLIHTFLSTPDGKAIGSFHLPFEVSNDMLSMIDCWRKKIIFRQHWDNAAFLEWTNSLINRGFLEKPDEYSSQQAPEDLYLHFFPFAQGMLYIGNTEALQETNIQRAQNLADAFSTAYSRYEDFVKLERAKEQVDTALTELKQAQSQLIQAEKMASLGELTAGIAHEIQNPLNFVNNFSEVNIELAAEMTQAAARGDLQEVKELSASILNNQEKINEHGRRADAIVKSMLQHSRSSTIASEPTDINKLADEYLRLAYHGLRAKDKGFNATLQMDLDASIGMVQVIPQEIGRVLLNLFNNALYAVNEKGKQSNGNYQPTVTVKTMKQNGNVEVQVIDNGNGIPEKITSKIFQPFFTTKPTGQGTGLGLSISYDIVQAHGGNLTVESKQKEFTRFTVILPVK